MLKESKVLIVLSFVSFSFLLLYLFFFTPQTFNILGEKLFLKYHQPLLAVKVLEYNDRKDHSSFFLLGRMYFVLGDIPKSLQNFDKAIELNPNIKEYYYGRGLAYGFAPDFFQKDSAKDFEKYIELDNLEYERTQRHAYGAWAAYNDLAWIYFKMGNFKRSLEITNSGLDISSYNPWLLNLAGANLVELGNCKEALRYFNQAEVNIQEISTKEFGEAYSGDDENTWENGKSSLRNTILENKEKCQ
jgi:tetratricopeptide (TPR) repeat protein